jgi:hypothetical protein
MTEAMTNPLNQEKASLEAAKQAEAWAQDDALARGKGSSPEQVAARQRVTKLFCAIHFAGEAAEATASRLAAVDYQAPVTTINGRTVDVQNPKAKGFLGLGRKPGYWVSEKYPPKGAEEPIYAIEYFPVKR